LDELLYPLAVAFDDSGVAGVDVGKRDFFVTKPAYLLAGRVSVYDRAIRVVE
jgi:hypothetical protein